MVAVSSCHPSRCKQAQVGTSGDSSKKAAPRAASCSTISSMDTVFLWVHSMIVGSPPGSLTFIITARGIVSPCKCECKSVYGCRLRVCHHIPIIEFCPVRPVGRGTLPPHQQVMKALTCALGLCIWPRTERTSLIGIEALPHILCLFKCQCAIQ